jgi:hypothetical protein
MAKIRGRRISGRRGVTRSGSRPSGIAAVRDRGRPGSRPSGIARASRSAMPSRRSAWASSMTPPSELRRAPSKPAVSFLRSTAGNENGSRVSSVMAGVAPSDPGKGVGFRNRTRRQIKCSCYVRHLKSAPSVESRRGAATAYDGAVASPRSSNRTCGFPASGFPTGVIAGHTAAGQYGHAGDGTPPACRRPLRD